MKSLGRRSIRSMIGRALVAAGLLAVAAPLHAQTENPRKVSETGYESLSLEELMSVRIVSASNLSEQLIRAPATVIVINRREIEERGYVRLSEIFDDLPAMEVVRPWGSTWFKNYWRGYRNTIGDPFLVMIDGIVFNHLYFNTADVLDAFPLSNVERIEVVYGPASSVYGPNATMGVINIITSSDQDADGSSQRIRFTGGSFDRVMGDLHYFYKKEDLRLSLTTRFDNGELDPGIEGRTEYTKNRYYSDPRLWGAFVENPTLGGEFSSPHQHRGLDFRAWVGDLELGIQYFLTDNGYGLEFAADRAQNRAVWAREDLSIHLRRTHDLSESTRSTTLVRYRESGVDPESWFVQSPLEPGPRVVDFSYWLSTNRSVSAFQDLEMKVGEDLTIGFGGKYERKDLQRAYVTNYGPTLPPEEIDLATYPYPDPPTKTLLANNRITTEDIGGYLQSRWRIDQRHQLHAGVRFDDNSKYGSAATFRGGLVGRYGKWSLKALYGEAFQEPNNRLLYGGWDGSGSDPTLEPERSQTWEASASYGTESLFGLLTLYKIRNRDTFVNTAEGAFNLGERDVTGTEFHLRSLHHPSWASELETWMYYSHYLDTDEEKMDEGGNRTGTGGIADLADHKIQAGMTARFEDRYTATLLWRYIGARKTIETNPVREIDSYMTFDLVLRARKLLFPGVGLTLKVSNLLDEVYAHPGIRDADAGVEPGRFVGDEWHGSSGFFTSVLPQPGRSILATFSLDLLSK